VSTFFPSTHIKQKLCCRKEESAKHAKTRTFRYSGVSVVNKTAVGIHLCGNCSVFSVQYLFILIEKSHDNSLYLWFRYKMGQIMLQHIIKGIKSFILPHSKSS
jgi:hypothetical protein